MSQSGKLGNQLNKLPRRLFLDRANFQDAVRGKFTVRVQPVYNAEKYSPSGSNNQIRFNITAAKSAPNLFCDLQSVYLKMKVNCYKADGNAGGAIAENAAVLFNRIRILTSQGQVISDVNNQDAWAKIKDGYRSRQEKLSDVYQGYDFVDGVVNIKSANNWVFVKLTDSLFNSAPLIPSGAGLPLSIELHLNDARRCGRTDGTAGLNDYDIREPELLVDMYQCSESYSKVVQEAIKRGELMIKYDTVTSYRQDVDGDRQIDFPIGAKSMVNSLWAAAVNKTGLTDGAVDAYRFCQAKDVNSKGLVSYRWKNVGYNGMSAEYRLPVTSAWNATENLKALMEWYIQFLKSGSMYRNPFTTTALSDYKDSNLTAEDPYTEWRDKHLVMSHRCALDASAQLDSGIDMRLSNPQFECQLVQGTAGGDAGLTMFLFAKCTQMLRVQSDRVNVIE